MQLVIAFLFLLLIAWAIAHFLGRKRHIGFAWSFVFSIFFLPPLGGLIVTLLSPKLTSSPPKPSSTKRIIGWILVALSVYMFLNVAYTLSTRGISVLPERPKPIFTPIIGLGLLGAYLIKLGKKRNIN